MELFQPAFQCRYRPVRSLPEMIISDDRKVDTGSQPRSTWHHHNCTSQPAQIMVVRTHKHHALRYTELLYFEHLKPKNEKQKKNRQACPEFGIPSFLPWTPITFFFSAREAGTEPRWPLAHTAAPLQAAAAPARCQLG